MAGRKGTQHRHTAGPISSMERSHLFAEEFSEDDWRFQDPPASVSLERLEPLWIWVTDSRALGEEVVGAEIFAGSESPA